MFLKLFLLWLVSVATIILFFMGAFPQSEKERTPHAPLAGINGRN